MEIHNELLGDTTTFNSATFLPIKGSNILKQRERADEEMLAVGIHHQYARDQN